MFEASAVEDSDACFMTRAFIRRVRVVQDKPN
jgi:hypothetical protein